MNIDILENVDPLLIAAVLSPVIIAMLGLLFVTVRQQRKINQLQEQLRPKYGFLGKPLYSVVALLVLVGGFGFTVIGNQNTPSVDDVSATNQIRATVDYEVIEVQGNSYLVRFNAIPYVNNQPWGIQDQEFDIFWELTGPSSFSNVELALSANSNGGFTMQVPGGSYQIKLDVFSDDNSAQALVSIEIP